MARFKLGPFSIGKEHAPEAEQEGRDLLNRQPRVSREDTGGAVDEASTSPDTGAALTGAAIAAPFVPGGGVASAARSDELEAQDSTSTSFYQDRVANEHHLPTAQQGFDNELDRIAGIDGDSLVDHDDTVGVASFEDANDSLDLLD
jgi:hypothetical protein